MTSLKLLLRALMPPLVWNGLKTVRKRTLPGVDSLVYSSQGWATRLPAGANSESHWSAFIARERSACETLIARVHAGEPILTSNRDEHLKHLLFGYVLACTALSDRQVSVLDYGGNLGDYYWVGRSLVPGLTLSYHCKELPRLAQVGRQVTPAVTWHTDDSCFARPYDLVMFCASLQCLPEWQDTLRRAAVAAKRYLLISDVPIVNEAPSFVAVDRSLGLIQLQQQLNRGDVLATVEPLGLRLIQEFDMGPHPRIDHAPEQPVCIGWLFERARA